MTYTHNEWELVQFVTSPRWGMCVEVAEDDSLPLHLPLHHRHNKRIDDAAAAAVDYNTIDNNRITSVTHPYYIDVMQQYGVVSFHRNSPHGPCTDCTRPGRCRMVDCNDIRYVKSYSPSWCRPYIPHGNTGLEKYASEHLPTVDSVCNTPTSWKKSS